MANGMEQMLMWQMLTAAGMDIGQGNPVGANVGAATNQNIASQNYLKILQQMLGPKNVPGGKASVDDGGLTVKYPADFLLDSGNKDFNTGLVGKPDFMLPGGSPSVDSGLGSSTVKMGAPKGGGANRLNPFALDLSQISASDLAGLSPSDLQGAANLTFAQRTATRRDAAQAERDTENARYRESLMAESRARMKQMKNKPSGTPSNLEKEYNFAVEHGYTDTPMAWENFGKTVSQKDYEYAKEQNPDIGTFTEWKLNLAKASGGLSSEGKAAEKAIIAKTQGEIYFGSYRWIEKFNDEFDGKKLEQKIYAAGMAGKPDEAGWVWDEKGRWIEEQLGAMGGKVVGFDWANNGRTGVWKVLWESNRTSEVRYDIGQRPKVK